MLLAFLAILVDRPVFKIVVDQGQPWLVVGKDRCILPQSRRGWRVHLDHQPLPNGTVLKHSSLPSKHDAQWLCLVKGDKQIAFADIQDLYNKWRRENHFGKNGAGEAMSTLIGPIVLDEFLVSPDSKYALALVGLCHKHQSFNPYITQILIRFDLPDLRPTLIADVGFHESVEGNRYGAHERLMVLGKTMYVAGQHGFQAFDGKKLGKVLEPITREMTPLGQVGQAGFVVAKGPNEVFVWHPAKKKRTFQVTGGRTPTYIRVSRSSNQFAIEDQMFNPSGTPGKWRIPARLWPEPREFDRAKQRVIPWKNYAVLWDGKTATIFNSASGKRLATVKKP